jgi:hypothetical protein
MITRAATMDELEAATGLKMKPIDLKRMHALCNDAGTLVFDSEGNGKHRLKLLYAKPEARGQDAKDLINAAFSWMFVNTDAMTIIGVFDLDNLACKAMVPHTPYKSLIESDGQYVYTITVASWIKARDVNEAARAMADAGFPDKANAVVSAWNAWVNKRGVTNG